MRLRAIVIAAGCVCVLSAQTPAPPPQQAPPIFRAGIDVVQIELSIIDRDHRPVHGLTKDDLQVFEDSKAQEIVELREIEVDDGTPPPVWSRAVQPDTASNDLADRRLIGIVIDDQNCCGMFSTTNTDYVAVNQMKEAATYLVDSLGAKDMAAIALTHELVGSQAFTSDREELRATIRRLKAGTEIGCAPLPPLPNLSGDMARLLSMSPQPVKFVVVVRSSEGTGGRMPPCPQRSYTIPDVGRRVIPQFQPDTGPEPDPFGLPPVPIYTIYAGRLSSQVGRGRGGAPIPDRATLPNLSVEEIFDQNSSYYLLGFKTSRPTLDGKLRRLEVKVPGHKDYIVRSRTGYIRPKPAPAPGSRAALNPEVPRPPYSVASLLPSWDFTLDAAVAAFAVPGSPKNAVVISVDMAHGVTEDLITGAEQLDLRTVVYQAGDPKHDTHVTATLDVPSGVRRVATTVPARIDLAPERYELWLTAHDARTSRVGSVSYEIEIPDRAAQAITFSGVVLGRDPTAAAPLPPVFAGIVPIVPTASRIFQQSDAIDAYFQLYQGRTTPIAPVSLDIRIVDERGQQKFTKIEALAPARFETARTADYRMRLPLDTLTAGRYLFSLEARLGDRISPRRDVIFTVR